MFFGAGDFDEFFFHGGWEIENLKSEGRIVNSLVLNSEAEKSPPRFFVVTGDCEKKGKLLILS